MIHSLAGFKYYSILKILLNSFVIISEKKLGYPFLKFYWTAQESLLELEYFHWKFFNNFYPRTQIQNFGTSSVIFNKLIFSV